MIKKIIKFLLLTTITAMLILIMGMAVITLREEKVCDIVSQSEDSENKATKVKNENEDCIGYIEIKNTSLSYPVMQSKYNPDYYLNHNYKKEYSFYGTPYLSAYCDLKKSDNLIIYGHNINGGRMFGALEQYKDNQFYEEHKNMYFTTDKKREYEIFAVMSVNINEFQYWKFTMAKDEEDFSEFMDDIRENAMYKTDIDIEYGEQLLMLSTCDNRRGEDWRIVVVSRKVKIEEKIR